MNWNDPILFDYYSGSIPRAAAGQQTGCPPGYVMVNGKCVAKPQGPFNLLGDSLKNIYNNYANTFTRLGETSGITRMINNATAQPTRKWKSFGRDRDWLESHAVWSNTGNQAWDDKVRNLVLTGKYGVDPQTGALHKLPPNEWANLSNQDRTLASDIRTWNDQQKVANPGVTTVRQPKQEVDRLAATYPQYKQYVETQKQKQKEADDRALREYVRRGTYDLITNPVMTLPGAILTGGMLAPAVEAAGAYVAPRIAAGLAAPLTVGSRVFPSVTGGNLLAAYGASDFLLNRAPQIPGQISRGEYGAAAVNTGLGALDLLGANMVSPSLINNTARLANQGRQYLSNTYRNIAEGDNIFNYAWRSPAAGITDDIASRMYQQTRNSIPLDESARDIIAEYQHTSGPFTGRFESGNVNLAKRLDLEDAIAQRNLVTQSGKPNVLIRRFDPDNPELYSLNESGQFILNRPTSWSVGRGWDYTSKPNRIVFKLPSGSRGLLNEYNAAKFDQDVSKLMVEREAIMGSGLNLGKRLGKVKNEFGGYDYIHRFKGYNPTEWDDIRRLNTENIGEIVDLNKNIAAGGNFNLGVYPFFKNPNILLKLGKVSQNEEFGINNRNVVTGIPELLRDMPTEAWGKIAIPFREINMTGLTSKTLNRPVIPNSEILGSIMQRAKGKPLSEYSVSDLENIQPWDYQDLANSVKHLANKGVGVDFYGDNFLLNKTDYGRNQFNLFDIGLLPNTNTGAFPVGPLYGLDAKAFNQGVNRIDPKMIKSILQDKMRRSVYESAERAGSGAYSDQEIFDAIQRINDRIQRADIKYKKGGPIVNQRGFMDGAPPKGSNWRIMGDGKGTSITMNLPNMPDEILVVPDGDFDQAKVMKQGQEEYFMGADFVDEYLLGQGGTTGPKIAVRDYPTMKGGGLTAKKAREILHDKEVHGRPLTDKQRRFFGAIAGGAKPYAKDGGGYGVFGYAPHMQIGGKTDDEKRALAKRTVEIARRRADKGQWVDVPQSIRDAAERLNESANSCIGGVCDVLKEANVIPNVIWSNTEFARLAPSLGFNAANRGWGLKGIENLEPGDVVQWMDPNWQSKKAVPHHGQIYLGTNSDGELEFFDNYNKTIKSYPRERIEEQLSWSRKPQDEQMQIYKINPYNPKPGNVNPEAQKALEEREANLAYQTGSDSRWSNSNPLRYEYSLRPDSPYINNPPTGMVEFLNKANDEDWVADVVRRVDKAGYPSRATRQQVHDSLLNVFGILGQENKWENPWVGGSYGIESLIERTTSPSDMSIGAGQIKYSQLSKPVRKAFGINRRQDLQDWDKVIPLMVGMDIANKQWMQNQGERFSERIIGQPGLRSDQFKWEEGRMSPYFYRGPGIKNIRKYVESLYGKDWYDKFKPEYMQTLEDAEEDPLKREQFVKENIRQYQKVFDPGSYGQRVFENTNRNLQRKILRWGETDVESTPENATTLQEVILTSKKPPRRQLGGNALAMLRDYGGGMSVPQLNSPSPKMKTGGLLSKTVTCSNCGHSWKGVDGGIDPLTCHKCGGMIKMKSGGQHGGLDRWFAEKWVDIKSGKPCGRQEGENRAYPACRPSKRVSSKTPKTSSELSSAEREKFKRSKTSSQRISYNHKRK